MHLDTRIKNDGLGFRAKNYYLTSVDGYKWEVIDQMPNGEPGSFDEVWREGLQVLKYDGKFWMFYAGNTRDPSKTLYGGKTNAYGIGLLVWDNPAGPWKRARRPTTIQWIGNSFVARSHSTQFAKKSSPMNSKRRSRPWMWKRDPSIGARSMT